MVGSVSRWTHSRSPFSVTLLTRQAPVYPTMNSVMRRAAVQINLLIPEDALGETIGTMQAVFGHLIVFAAEALHAVLLLCAECTNTSFAPQTSPSPFARRSVDRAVVGVGAIMAPCRRFE